MECWLCGGECFFIGRLGRKLWFRCIRCGINQGRDATADDEEVLREVHKDDDDDGPVIVVVIIIH